MFTKAITNNKMDLLFLNITFIPWITAVVAGIMCSYAAPIPRLLYLDHEWKFSICLEKLVAFVIFSVSTICTYCLLKGYSVRKRTLAENNCEAKMPANSEKCDRSSDSDDLADENCQEISPICSNKPEISTSTVVEDNCEEKSLVYIEKPEVISYFDYFPENQREINSSVNPFSSLNNFKRQNSLGTEENQKQFTKNALVLLKKRKSMHIIKVRNILKWCIEEMHELSDRLKSLTVAEIKVLQKQSNASEYVKSISKKSNRNLPFKKKILLKQIQRETLSGISDSFYSHVSRNSDINMRQSEHSTELVSDNERIKNLEIKQLSPIRDDENFTKVSSNYQGVSAESVQEISPIGNHGNASESMNLEECDKTAYEEKAENLLYNIRTVHSVSLQEFLAKNGLLKKFDMGKCLNIEKQRISAKNKCSLFISIKK